jgi:RNA polymerase sigma-70 factor (ECF subfamily)
VEAVTGDQGEAVRERELIRRAQSGDRDAFGALIRRYQRRIFALGLRFFGNADDAEDLVQDTFLRAWRNVQSFDAERPLAPWLLRIASNRALTELETRKRRGGEELDDRIAWTGAGADDDLDRRRLEESVRREVDRLPEDQRMILLLRTMEGMRYREIADALDIPIGTVMSRLARARETLRKRVRR